MLLLGVIPCLVWIQYMGVLPSLLKAGNNTYHSIPFKLPSSFIDPER